MLLPACCARRKRSGSRPISAQGPWASSFGHVRRGSGRGCWRRVRGSRSDGAPARRRRPRRTSGVRRHSLGRERQRRRARTPEAVGDLPDVAEIRLEAAGGRGATQHCVMERAILLAAEFDLPAPPRFGPPPILVLDRARLRRWWCRRGTSATSRRT